MNYERYEFVVVKEDFRDSGFKVLGREEDF